MSDKTVSDKTSGQPTDTSNGRQAEAAKQMGNCKK
jgi:hypothetical protein